MDIQIVAPPTARDYPRTWTEFLDRFGSEEACLAYLQKLRWPTGFVCPACAVIEAPYRSSRGRLMCRACGRQSTVTAGTIFDKTRTPLRVWLAAAWYLTNQKQGVSALGLQRVLGLGSYQTAWTLLHRYRRAMVRPAREPLRGCVEVDETYVAITDRNNPAPKAKSHTNQPFVIMAVEMLEPRGFGRIRLRRIRDDSDRSVIPFVQECIEPGSCVRTDGSAAYRSLPELGYQHERRVQLGAGVPAHVSMAGVHRVASLLKRWLLGTHHGSVQPEHLDAYLEEFVFRFNRRRSGSRGLLFYRLLEQAVVSEPLTYEQVVHPRARRGRIMMLDKHPVS
jgi:transposase-like protein